MIECVKENFNRSKFLNYDKGVRQGCILSPLLCNLDLNEHTFILNNKVKDPILLLDGSLNCLPGSMYVSGKLPTYPSPNLTLTLTSCFLN